MMFEHYYYDPATGDTDSISFKKLEDAKRSWADWPFGHILDTVKGLISYDGGITFAEFSEEEDDEADEPLDSYLEWLASRGANGDVESFTEEIELPF